MNDNDAADAEAWEAEWIRAGKAGERPKTFYEALADFGAVNRALPVEVTTDILDPFEVVYTCPECGQVVRRCDAGDYGRTLAGIIGHALAHEQDRVTDAAFFGEACEQ